MPAESTAGLLIALLGALGGAVALLTYAESRRRRLVPHLSLSGTELVLADGTLRTRSGATAAPPVRFHLDLKNDSSTPVSVHQIDFICERIETVDQPVVIAVRWKDASPEAERNALVASERLEPVGNTPGFQRFRASSRDALARITAHAAVAEAFIDAVGEPHRTFESADVVVFDLRPPETTYSSRVARTVPERDTLTVPIDLNWSRAVRGRARLQVAYEGNRTLEAAEFDFDLPAVTR